MYSYLYINLGTCASEARQAAATVLVKNDPQKDKLIKKTSLPS